MSVARHLFLISAAAVLAAACSSTPKPDPGKSEPVASPAAANEKLGGYWLISVQRGGQSTDNLLHIQLTAGELVGSLTGPDGNSRDVSKVALAGDKVSWEIGSSSQGGMVQRFEGKLTGASSMEGSVKMVRAQRGSGSGSRKGGGSGSGSSGSSGSDSGDSSGSSSGDGTAPSDGGSSSSGGTSGSSGHGGRGGHGRGGRGGSGGTTVTWRAFKSVEPQPQATPAPSKAGDPGF